MICHSNRRVSICDNKAFHFYIEDQCCVVSFMVTFKQIEQWEKEEWPEVVYMEKMSERERYYIKIQGLRYTRGLRF